MEPFLEETKVLAMQSIVEKIEQPSPSSEEEEISIPNEQDEVWSSTSGQEPITSLQ